MHKTMRSWPVRLKDYYSKEDYPGRHYSDYSNSSFSNEDDQMSYLMLKKKRMIRRINANKLA